MSRVRSNSRVSSCRRSMASLAFARADDDSCVATMLTTRNANRMIQLYGSASVSVPIGGRKKKLKQNIAATEVSDAVQSSATAPTNSTTSRYASAMLVGFVVPVARNRKVAIATDTPAAAA